MDSLNIVYDIVARKVLARHAKRAMFMDKIEQLAADPAALANNIKRLKGTNSSRLRVGDWRIVFHVEGDTLFITGIGPRGGIYA